MSDTDEANNSDFHTIVNYSQLWGISGKVYNLGNWTLPIPLPISASISFLMIIAPVALVIFLLELATNAYIWAVALSLSFFFAYLSDKPGVGGRTMIETIKDQVGFVFSKKMVQDLEDGVRESGNSFNSEVFVPQDDLMALTNNKKG